MSRVMRSAEAAESPYPAGQPAAEAVEYPYSDGQPMAESEAQLRTMVYLLGVLYGRYRERADVYVGGDMFLYYERGNPAAVVAPDVFVVVGAPKREEAPRLSYKLWEEPKGPDFVLEVASRRTWTKDRDEKPAVYAKLGVAEYWRYDPTGELYAPRLGGMRLAGGRYRDPVPEVAALGGRMLHSAVLGLDLRLERGGGLRVRDPVTGRDFLAYDEEAAARREAEARATEEAAVRRAAEVRAAEEAAARADAEAQVAELRARLRELQGERRRPVDGQ